MQASHISNVLTNRFLTLGAIDPVSFPDRVLTVVREWLTEVIELPPKDAVMTATESALKRAFAGFDTPGPDVIVEPILISTILTLVAYAYDALAKESAI